MIAPSLLAPSLIRNFSVEYGEKIEGVYFRHFDKNLWLFPLQQFRKYHSLIINNKIFERVNSVQHYNGLVIQ